ncbi:MAG TPA: nucleotidyltransferase family protein [Chloroflexota bacterium]
MTAPPAELQLILSCVQRAANPGGAAPPGSPERTAAVWRRAVPLAGRAGLAPIAFAGGGAWLDEAPADVADALRWHHVASGLRHERSVAPTLRRALGALASAGLVPIVLKGAALAYTAYPEPAQRTLSDVDLLLSDDQLPRASEVLREAGFWTRDGDSRPDHHLQPCYLGDGRVGVELHGQLLPDHSPYRLPLNALRARSRAVTIADAPARVLAPADALLLTCVHLAYAHRYRWFALRTLADVLVLAAGRASELDWDLLTRTTEAAGAGGAVYWPLRLAREWVGAPVPGTVLAALEPSRPLRNALAPIVAARTCSTGPPTDLGGDGVEQLLLDLSLREGCSASERLRALGRGLFPPSSHLGHLPAEVAGSRLRYAAYLGRPSRAARGLQAVGRLVALNLAQPTTSRRTPT